MLICDPALSHYDFYSESRARCTQVNFGQLFFTLFHLPTYFRQLKRSACDSGRNSKVFHKSTGIQAASIDSKRYERALFAFIEAGKNRGKPLSLYSASIKNKLNSIITFEGYRPLYTFNRYFGPSAERGAKNFRKQRKTGNGQLKN